MKVLHQWLSRPLLLAILVLAPSHNIPCVFKSPRSTLKLQHPRISNFPHFVLAFGAEPVPIRPNSYLHSLGSNLTDYVSNIVDTSDIWQRLSNSDLRNSTTNSELLSNLKQVAAPFIQPIFDSVAKVKHQRIVLSYNFGSCGYKSLESGVSPTMQGQSIRRKVLSELASKVGTHLSPENPDTLSGQAAPPLFPLHTTYLDALRMEVTAVPEGVTNLEFMDMAHSIPCVERAYVDEDKYGKEDQEIGLASLKKTVKKVMRKLKTVTNEPTPLLNKGNHMDGTNLVTSLERGLPLCQLDPNRCTSARPENLRIPATPEPRDSHFEDQWYLSATAPGSANVEAVWPWWTGNEPGMTIAVIDSGCDMSHPDLKNKYWKNEKEICDDGIDNDMNGLVDDCYGYDFANGDPNPESEGSGHGTGAAAIIGAQTNNGEGISAVCWGCKIMCLKFIGGGRGLVSNQVQAIDYAVRMGARISNNSYGGYGRSELERDAIKRAQLAGHLFVCSAGNNNLDTDLGMNDHTPSVYDLPNIIAVGGTDYKGEKATFSNFGRRSVDVFAPAVKIRTAKASGGYVNRNGTSFACPTVAGLVGLLWTAFPNLTYMQIKQAVIDGCIGKKNKSLQNLSVCQGYVDAKRSLYVAALMNAGDYPGRQELEKNGGLRMGAVPPPPRIWPTPDFHVDRGKEVVWNDMMSALKNNVTAAKVLVQEGNPQSDLKFGEKFVVPLYAPNGGTENPHQLLSSMRNYYGHRL